MNSLIWKYLDRQAKKEIIKLKEKIRELESCLAEEIDGQNMVMAKLCRASDEIIKSIQYAELLRKQIESQDKMIAEMQKRLTFNMPKGWELN